MKMGDEWKELSKLQPHQSVFPHNCQLSREVSESNPTARSHARCIGRGTDKRYRNYNQLIAILKEQA
jgi:hypothetical protein